jgi:hypothetical protein
MNLRKLRIFLIFWLFLPFYCVGCGQENEPVRVKKVEAESGQNTAPDSNPPGQVKRIASH